VSEEKENVSTYREITLFALLVLRRLNHRYFLTALHAIHAPANRFSSSCRCLFIFRLIMMITVARPEGDNEYDIKCDRREMRILWMKLTHKPEDSQNSSKRERNIKY